MPSDLIPVALRELDAKGLLKQVYGDLAKPGVTQVGLALSTVLGLGSTILWPIQLLNERTKLFLEANLERYREKLAGVSPEQIVPVPTEIGVPLAEKLSYVTDKISANFTRRYWQRLPKRKLKAKYILASLIS